MKQLQWRLVSGFLVGGISALLLDTIRRAIGADITDLQLIGVAMVFAVVFMVASRELK